MSCFNTEKAEQREERGFLSSKLMFPVKRRMMFPKYAARAEWKRIAEDTRISGVTSGIIKRAQKVKKSPMPELRASDFMLYRINGNRSIYQKPYFEMRNNLEMLVLAECFEGKKEYINRILDYIWAICSEPCWVIPAHIWITDDVLPPADYIRNDLFATQTGLLMGMILDLMEDELAAISPNLVERIRRNIISRLIVKLENGPEEDWHNGNNNWTPWCCSNLLGAALAALKNDPERLEKVIRRLAEINDRYFKKFSDDGACDEGPSYWGKSPVEFCRFIEQGICAGIFSEEIYRNGKLRAMIEYICQIHLGHGTFFSYSDSSPRFDDLPCGMLALLAGRLNDKNIAVFAKQSFHKFKGEKHFRRYSHDIHSAVLGNLTELFHVPDVPYEEVSDNTTFYRSRGYLAGRCGKLGFGVKGGNNHECHNQNDVGHFVISLKGKFIILDMGGETYTHQYFAPETRYDHISCNAHGHNMPLFDGIGESAGADKEPQSITFSDENNIITCTIEAADCYPRELELEKVCRTFTFDRNTKRFTITDKWSGRKERVVQCSYLSEFEPQIISDRAIKLGGITFSTSEGKLECSKFETADIKLQKTWKQLWMIKLTHPEPVKSASHTITIDAVK